MRSIVEFWDAAADTFDREPDHGLGDPAVRAAWAALLQVWLPPAPVDVLDLGCGTGTLSLLLAEQGHRLTGVDLSARMVELAEAKLTAAGVDGRVLVGDAGDPPVGRHRFDVVLARHLLWTLPDPAAALRRWVGLPAPRCGNSAGLAAVRPAPARPAAVGSDRAGRAVCRHRSPLSRVRQVFTRRRQSWHAPATAAVDDRLDRSPPDRTCPHSSRARAR